MIHQDSIAPLNRDHSIDIIRGLAILLVIVGHTIQYNTVHFDDNILFKLIYSFHMPLFMFISGYVLAIHPPKSTAIPFILKKFNQLVIPFLIWYFCIAYFANNQYASVDFFDYVKKLIISPDYGYWFLWVLFLNFMIFSGISIIGKKISEWIIVILILLIIEIMPTFYFGHALLKWYFPFFLSGYFFVKIKHKLVKISHKKYIFAIYLLFLFLLFFWNRTSPTPIIEIITNIPISPKAIFIIDKFYHLITAFIGIFLIFDITNRFIQNSRIANYLTTLGSQYTLDIYVIHIYFITLLSWIPFYPAMIIANAIFALVISLIISYFIRKNKLFSYLLLGIKKSTQSHNK